MKLALRWMIASVMVLLLAGCLYPDERLKQNQIPHESQVASVQQAVDQYRQATGGLLPIKTRDMKTPIYQKYPIDFQMLVPRYMQEPPGNAFESGGIFQYVIVDAETNPTVKLLDLRMADQIRDLKLRLQMYRDSHGYPPFKNMVAKGVFTLDYKKLGYKEPPYAISPFSGNNLPFVIDYNGEIYVDYRIDLYDMLKKTKASYKPGDDIRDLLVKNSLFVPAYSLPYTIDEHNEPIFLTK
ncbi:hypothetical protein GFC29_1489 [Anoxybacillus sp. B7M1]|jgi:hypothetical protein|uniref:ABC transporter periplasmic binding protein yphF n=1 Tax=Anoxybacteroides rupiense TaxID=311460 RepID=A0ABD5IUL5_9BACL|nr:MULTISPECIES: hypothetical protein [Anoxybacillus]ANB58789.1 hypothetical protein GFC28_136 [Anoxybacillus sp. B2M1]ANB64964.1 hypothetical protein GFC29_1489 [Anoxybacillus sp. B7M1]KXG11052.1 hypothetical protein AT864_00135 [Anoxybacillus sp. P3H1B]MBB3906628.1 hypothetical protein [Anoxybacillus rupiensis]MBS2770249.1 hypothetical protein [Anoxybacillus rupiensis]